MRRAEAPEALCPLCGGGRGALFCTAGGRRYHRCPGCDLRFLDPAQRLGPQAERARYLRHTPAAGDPGYAAFVQPLLAGIAARVPRGARGLDFGCGREAALSAELEAAGYAMRRYDPLFHPEPESLAGGCEFAVACEVLEHLYQPAAELERLRALLVPGGWLAAMTLLWQPGPGVRFADWHYRRDPTHVAFYSPAALRWIAARFGFAELCLEPPRLVWLRA